MRTNLALADHDYRAGEYDEALDPIRTALARLTRRNANPLDAEAFYLAGLVLRRLGRTVEAERRSARRAGTARGPPPPGLELARSLARRGEHRAALRVLDTLDGVVGHDTRRTALRAIILRRAGPEAEAAAWLEPRWRPTPSTRPCGCSPGRSPRTDAGVLLDVALDLATPAASGAALAVLDAGRRGAAAGAGNVRPSRTTRRHRCSTTSGPTATRPHAAGGGRAPT